MDFITKSKLLILMSQAIHLQNQTLEFEKDNIVDYKMKVDERVNFCKNFIETLTKVLKEGYSELTEEIEHSLKSAEHELYKLESLKSFVELWEKG